MVDNIDAAARRRAPGLEGTQQGAACRIQRGWQAVRGGGVEQNGVRDAATLQEHLHTGGLWSSRYHIFAQAVVIAFCILHHL